MVHVLPHQQLPDAFALREEPHVSHGVARGAKLLRRILPRCLANQLVTRMPMRLSSVFAAASGAVAALACFWPWIAPRLALSAQGLNTCDSHGARAPDGQVLDEEVATRIAQKNATNASKGLSPAKRAAASKAREACMQRRGQRQPVTFRSILECDGVDAEHDSPRRASLIFACPCRRCAASVTVEAQSVQSVRCNCAHCQRYHAAPFSAFLVTTGGSRTDTSAVSAFEDMHNLQTWNDQCIKRGAVERISCKYCGGKLATRASGQLHIALGAVDEETVPGAWARAWQTTTKEWVTKSRSTIWHAQPLLLLMQTNFHTLRTQELQGGCACGNCRFRANLLAGEAQHCYCSLCRRYSGSVAMTWMPSGQNSFQWIQSETLELRRTTGHGQRHMCSMCGTTMTIVYDADPSVTWPAAGALHDDAIPPDIDAWLYRVVHIGCSWMQSWYQLPNDRLERLTYAG